MTARRLEISCVIALLICTALIYLPTLGYSFVADDSSQILANTHVHSWRYIPVYFTSHVWAQIALTPGEHAAPYYRPVFLLWLLLNYSLFGYSTAAWHASAVLLHVAVTLLVYLLARRLLSHWSTAVAAALLFGLHPVHIEAVAWVSGASEPIMAVPFLGAVICYIEASRSPRAKLWFAASIALYFAAMLGKETAIVLPAILIAYDLLLREPSLNPKFGAILRRIAFFAVTAAAYWAMRIHALSGIHVNDVPVTTFLATLPAAVCFYLSHLLAPVGLSFFYNFAYVESFRLSATLLPLAVIAVALALIALWARIDRIVAFAAIWMVVTILPPLDLPAFLRYELVHDRYLYLPSVGFCILLALAVRVLVTFLRARPKTALAATAGIALAYAALTLRESPYWSNEAALFTRSFQIGNHNWSAERNYAYALARSSRCDEVMDLLSAFVDENPNDSKSTFALGSCYFHLRQLGDAERLMVRTARLEPHYQQPRLLLAAIRLQQGRIAEAEMDWRSAVRAQGLNEELSLHYVHGEILKAQGRLADAAKEFRKELEVQPGNSEIAAELESIEPSIQKP